VLSGTDGRLGLQNWHAAGGIAGRGILIDYWSYAKEAQKTFDATKGIPIKFDDLMDCLRLQQQESKQPLQPRPGDILFIRSGFTQRYLQLDEREERLFGIKMPPETCGVQQDRRLLEWLWTNRFAAVGGDAPGWECFPPEASAGFLFHEVLIAGWGCPIAELLWLEDLARFCAQNKKMDFLRVLVSS
jgi:hypothetical protein